MLHAYPDAGPSGLTTSQVVADLQANNPGKRFAVSPTGETIGVETALYGFIPCYTLLLPGCELQEWVKIWGLPQVNGEDAIKEWIEA